MDHELRRQLVDALNQVPAAMSFDGRTALVGTLSNAVNLNRHSTNVRADLELVVDQLSEFFLDTGEWSLLIFIDNAIHHVKYVQLGRDLEGLRQQLQNGITAPASFRYQLARTCDFDLIRLVEECLILLLEKEGLVGFAVPCDDEAFRTNFCERLKDELQEAGSVQSRQPLALTSKFTSAELAIEIIGNYRRLLQGMDVLCPVRVQVSNENIISNFWQGLCQEFTGTFEHRLIVLMFLPEDSESILPKDVTRLSPPRFNSVDVFQWVCAVVHSLPQSEYTTKKEHVISIWKESMIAECSRGDTLHIRRVYEHMEDTLAILRQGLTVEDFCARLKERRSLYASTSH